MTSFCAGGKKAVKIGKKQHSLRGFVMNSDGEWGLISVKKESEGEKTMNRLFDFGEALKALKAGKRVSREGWNGKGLFVVYQKAYPQGIPCNKQTAQAWGMKEGELFRCEPYLQINTVDGSHAMWVPSIRDCLAEDWFVMEE